jgi:hypothetical protein
VQQTRIIQKANYKGWSIMVSKKRFNIAKPYIVAIHDPEGHSRTMFRIEGNQMMMATKETTYASLSTAREAGEAAINSYMKPA